MSGTNRREFLTGAAWLGAMTVAAGCVSRGRSLCAGAGLHNFTVPPMSCVRVGVIGVGERGLPAVKRLSQIPGCRVTAISDINAARLDAAQTWLKENKLPAAREWSRDGAVDAWKGLCDSDVCDVVYSATPRPLHCPINVYAMDHGKHVMQEVPGAFSLDECWETIEAAERNRRHCMMLENCTYGEAEMLAYNLIHQGKLGEIMQAEVGYTHDQRALQYNPKDGIFWRLDRHLKRHGNYYPTHGLVPAGRCLDINRGDRFETIVSVETASQSFETYARETFPASDWRHNARMVKGDINMSFLRTVKGHTVVLKHNVCTPSPYDRGNFYLGTRGLFKGINFVANPAAAMTDGSPVKMVWLDKIGDHAWNYFDWQKVEEVREAFKHPFWRVAGDMARKVGGHGGMDFVMDLRWVYCLQHGLPLDTDVYDLATYSSIVELSERSVCAGGAPVEIPDFTRGGWQVATPVTDEMLEGMA